MEICLDEEGLVKFSPENESLRCVTLFLQDDVGILPSVCEELLQIQMWNGDRFLLLKHFDYVQLTDKYGGTTTKIDTKLFIEVVEKWKDFVSNL